MTKVALTFLLSSILPLISFSQLNSLDKINKSIKEVQTESESFKQNLEHVDAKGGLLISIVEINKKGKTNSNTYEFNLSDISKENVRYKINRDIIEINIQTKEDLPFIKFSENGTFKKYTGNFKFYCRDFDAVKDILEILTQSITEVNSITESEPFPKAFQETKVRLKSTVVNVRTEQNELLQSIIYDQDNSLIATYKLEKNSSKEQIERLSKFNLYDLDTQKPSIKVNNDYFDLEFKTKANKSYISVLENGEAKKSINKLQLHADSPEKVKLIINAFQNITTLSENEYTKTVPNVIDYNHALAYLKLGFNIEVSDNCDTKISQEYDKKKSEYLFNFYDLDEYSPTINVDGSLYEIEVASRQKFNYISIIENDLSLKYVNSFSISNSDLDKVRNADEAVKTIIKECQKKFKLNIPTGDLGVLTEWLKVKVPNFKNESSEIVQKLQTTDGNPCNLSYKSTFSEKGKTTEMEYEVKAQYFDSFSSKINVDRQNVYVDFFTKGKEKIISLMENGKPGNFTNQITFQIDDITRAKEVYEVFNTLIKECK